MADDGSLSLYEAVQLFYLALSAQDRFFEFWISATFAVIIAYHQGSHTLAQGFSTLMAFLYTAFSINMLSRWLLAQSAVERYRDEMLALSGGDGRLELVDLSRSLTFGTLIIGTLITLYFVWFIFKKRKEILAGI